MRKQCDLVVWAPTLRFLSADFPVRPEAALGPQLHVGARHLLHHTGVRPADKHTYVYDRQICTVLRAQFRAHSSVQGSGLSSGLSSELHVPVMTVIYNNCDSN